MEILRKKRIPQRNRVAALALAALTATTLVSCGGNEGEADSEGQSIVVQTTDTIPDRVAATEEIIAGFEEETGIQVELVGVAEDQFNQVLTSGAAAGDLPDVIGSIGLTQVRTLGANDLVNTQAVQEVLETLGEETFSERALELNRDGEELLAIPSESWLQLLYYRTDLFEEAGLAAPETYEDILAAAEALDSPEMAGFVGATAPGDAFTQQTIEHVALGNGCEMVNEAGEVIFNSPECIGALDFYGNLIQNYSVSGAQDVDTVRANYFAGEAAMFIWSTFVLDEMAGLRNDALPTCPECADNPAFLAENTGVVPAIVGPDGSDPAQFGQITNWTITASANTEPAKQFVEYMMSDGYVDWLAIAPEGKVPVRAGTAESPTEFADAWQTLPVGVDTKAPLQDFYSDDVLQALQTGVDNLLLWGIPQGQGDLAGAALGELPIAQAVADVANGGADPAAAAEQAAATLQSIQDSLE
ncbi:multiple sugar transport system substrate-binding protein [Arthrobacter pigmenti]|uniref:Multiple sugar transport system substrate-binding protein n=1 Tax=Arthrobacter pigmenti TaxID=271432 RepID=A0A846RK47_9MICC|nr:extracellular solute-binding protein [Arthrobacter pigmenti]NJC21032.1 multiple sugar transport system substrate-binding protein [Arthrobacter pigmenti]